MKWKVLTIVLLVSLSVVSYLVHFAIFRDVHHIFIYMIGDIAFLPVEVLLVTLIIERLLSERERRAILKKLNMLIGAFYSEAGFALIKYHSVFISSEPELSRQFIVTGRWSEKDFAKASGAVSILSAKIDCLKIDLRDLRSFLESKRAFMLGLLSNPNLFEHDSFTDLLWAALHLSEELSARDNLEGLPESDYQHISDDMKRLFIQLVSGWLSYMKHLKADYPFLFSLAVRTNPLNPDASPVVE